MARLFIIMKLQSVKNKKKSIDNKAQSQKKAKFSEIRIKMTLIIKEKESLIAVI